MVLETGGELLELLALVVEEEVDFGTKGGEIFLLSIFDCIVLFGTNTGEVGENSDFGRATLEVTGLLERRKKPMTTGAGAAGSLVFFFFFFLFFLFFLPFRSPPPLFTPLLFIIQGEGEGIRRPHHK